MNPGTHHRLRRRYQILGAVLGAACLLLYAFDPSARVFPNILLQFVLFVTPLVVSPSEVRIINQLTLIALLFVFWVGPSLIFRWIIVPRCPHCGTQTRLTTESGIHYVCRSCGHCHDTGTMQVLAEAEGQRFQS